MSLFGKKEQKVNKALKMDVALKEKRIRQLEKLCAEKDQFFLGAISDGLRHGSSEAARHMADRKKFLKGK